MDRTKMSKLSIYGRNQMLVRLHTSLAWGRLKLKDLTQARVRWVIGRSWLRPEQRDDAQGARRVSHKAGQTVRDGLISRNVTETIKVPQVRRDHTARSRRDQEAHRGYSHVPNMQDGTALEDALQ